jgi:omega-6 fatty acid desaturase (delta-12 desaturase)
MSKTGDESNRTPGASSTEPSSWREIVTRYHRPDLGRAWWQVVNTFLPYLALWYLMFRSLEISYWITLGICVIASGLHIRIFIIFHDCGHGSFFRSRKANDVLGFITGVMTFTPYAYWRHCHAIHHATAGNLDRRGTGDIWTITVREYQALSRWHRLLFRLYRNPIVLFLLGPMFLFLIRHRFASRGAGWRWHLSVIWTNLALLGVAVALSLVMGIRAYLMIQLPVMLITGVIGVWLFYVQHQFEGVYWERQAAWDYVAVALRGSSFYKLPKVLQWFSGSIGFHHIHHLSPRIPNYLLERCHRENPIFQNVKALRLWESLKTLRLRVWDEEQRKLVGLGPFYL